MNEGTKTDVLVRTQGASDRPAVPVSLRAEQVLDSSEDERKRKRREAQRIQRSISSRGETHRYTPLGIMTSRIATQRNETQTMNIFRSISPHAASLGDLAHLNETPKH